MMRPAKRRDRRSPQVARAAMLLIAEVVLIIVILALLAAFLLPVFIGASPEQAPAGAAGPS